MKIKEGRNEGKGKGKDKRKGKKQNKKQPIMPTTPNGGDKKKGTYLKEPSGIKLAPPSGLNRSKSTSALIRDLPRTPNPNSKRTRTLSYIFIFLSTSSQLDLPPKIPNPPLQVPNPPPECSRVRFESGKLILCHQTPLLYPDLQDAFTLQGHQLEQRILRVVCCT